MSRVVLPDDLTMVDLIDPGDALGENGFAGAIVPTERGHLAGIKVQVHVGQCLHRAKVLADAAGLEEGLPGRRVFDHLRHAFTLSREETRRRRVGGGALLI